MVHKQRLALKGRDQNVGNANMPPLQGSFHSSHVTQACARSSLCLGYYICGPSALQFSRCLDHNLITPPTERRIAMAKADGYFPQSTREAGFALCEASASAIASIVPQL